MATESAPTAPARPPIVGELTWTGDLRFRARAGRTEIVVDSEGTDGPSPMQTLLVAFAGCMGMDIVHFLNKSRVSPTAARLSVTGHRASGHPGRFVGIDLHVDLDGAPTDDQVKRAIELSRSTYCSVWNSMGQDIALNVTFRVNRESVRTHP
jgi:putative redox protein